jgi:hypothetical protein
MHKEMQMLPGAASANLLNEQILFQCHCAVSVALCDASLSALSSFTAFAEMAQLPLLQGESL